MNRIEFVKSSAVFSAMMASAPSILNAQGKRTFNVALVGCGGRGNGAAGNLVEAAKIVGVEVKFVAAADYFVDKAKAFAKCGLRSTYLSQSAILACSVSAMRSVGRRTS